MKQENQLLKKVRVRNFKAIRDSGPLALRPLTVLVGSNGTGKSSLVEALELVHNLVALDSVDAAMQLWRGFEHVRNKQQTVRRKADLRSSSPIEIQIQGRLPDGVYSARVSINERANANELFLESEDVRYGNEHLIRTGDATCRAEYGGEPNQWNVQPGRSLLSYSMLDDFIDGWQFLSLNGQTMGEPRPQMLSRATIHLAKDGANIAEYLLRIKAADPTVLEGIIDTARYVLPYATDLQPSLTSELGRQVYLQMSERDFKVPGWLLSTGTLRVVALLAVLRHPSPPPLVVIEEIENGLDPRALNLIVDEIRGALEAGRTQVILTTHSPYLLDLLPLPSLLLCSRVDGEAAFHRPSDEAEVRAWAETFSPGQLYTAGRLKGPGQP